MKNPIVCSALFKTPSSIQQLMEIAETMSNSSEAWLMMTFTLNYCHMMVREELDREEARQEDHRQLELF